MDQGNWETWRLGDLETGGGGDRVTGRLWVLLAYGQRLPRQSLLSLLAMTQIWCPRRRTLGVSQE